MNLHRLPGTGQLSLFIVLSLSAFPALALECPLPQVVDVALPADPNAPTELTADAAELGDDGESVLKGNVRLEQSGRAMEADEIRYNRETGRAQVKGNARFRGPTFSVESESADLEIKNEQGEFYNSRFAMTESHARGSAGTLSSDGKGSLALQDAEYTTCPQGEGTEFWKLRAKRVEIDNNTGWGKAWGTQLRIKDIPVAYIPYFWFPVDDRRQTGFLPPRIGDADNTGLDISAPYYFNIAPNYDATVTPRYLSERGNQLSGEFRYLALGGSGLMGAEYLFDDERTNDDRDLFTFRHDGYLTTNSRIKADYTRVSDNEYFQDLDNRVGANSLTHLKQGVSVNWQPSRWFWGSALVQDYQTIDNTITVAEDLPYTRLPQVRLHVITPYMIGFQFGLDTEATAFSHDDNNLPSTTAIPEGERFDIRPRVSWKWDNGGNYINSELAVRYTAYKLDNVAPGADDQPDRTLPSFNIEFGQRYERILSNGRMQTLQPRVFYQYVASENQDDLPIFDSGDPDFLFYRLFEENRYTGIDRIGDANHVALAVTSRWLDADDGSAWLEYSIGQIFRFSDPEVLLPGAPPPNDSRSDLVNDIQLHLNKNWTTGMSVQYDTEESEINRGSVRVRYHDDADRLVGVAYRFRRQLLEQTDLSFGLPLGDKWRAIGRWNHSIRDDEDVESLIGLQYRSCCWSVTTAFRRYLNGVPGEHNNAFYVQFDLLGLAQFGDNFDRLLERDTLRNVDY